jgi:hypothetical protein
MDVLDLARQNLVSPIVLSFVLGLVATWVKSDLKVPEPLHNALSLYLLLAIGLKGGGQFATVPFESTIRPGLATLALGVATPLVAFFAARLVLRVARHDAAALAAHYGSVSAVTFIAAQEFVRASGLASEHYLAGLVVVLEIPGIAIGIALAGATQGGEGFRSTVKEAVTGKGVILLGGGFIIGLLSGEKGLSSISPFFVAGFKGVLVLFLLELGLTAATQLRNISARPWRLIGFGIVIPIFHGCLGVLLGHFAGLSPGGAAVLGAMASSASYIAAPAAVRTGIPSANPGLYLTAAIGITFPFNLVCGIPLYTALASHLQ